MHKHIFFLFFLLGPVGLAGSLAQTSDPAGWQACVSPMNYNSLATVASEL